MSNDKLANVSKSVISSTEEMSTFLQNLKEHTYPLFPETVNFGVRPEFKLSATIVSVDVNNERDVYPVDGGKYALHLNKINEIAQASDLKITDSRIIDRKVDNDGRVTYISHQVSWEMRNIDGSIKSGVATGKYDYYNDVATKKEGQVKTRRKHAEALAESNALTRAFNKAIAKLPQSFSKNELSKPFLIPCVIQDTNELLRDLDPATQKKIKEEYARKQLGIIGKLYEEPTALPPAEKPAMKLTKKENVEEATFVEKEEMSQEQINEILADEFKTATQEDRTNKILNLVKQKGYEDPKGVTITAKRIEKQTVDNQCGFILKLLNYQPEDAPL